MCLHTKWHFDPSSRWPQQTWAENWGLCPFFGELGPCLTQCGLAKAYLRTKWHLDPCSHLATTEIDLDPSIHLATIHHRHRQDRQRSNSIGRIVLQMVAQKFIWWSFFHQDFFLFYIYMGCILAPPGEYDWAVGVRRRCGLMSNYFHHFLNSYYIR